MLRSPGGDFKFNSAIMVSGTLGIELFHPISWASGGAGTRSDSLWDFMLIYCLEHRIWICGGQKASRIMQSQREAQSEHFRLPSFSLSPSFAFASAHNEGKRSSGKVLNFKSDDFVALINSSFFRLPNYCTLSLPSFVFLPAPFHRAHSRS